MKTFVKIKATLSWPGIPSHDPNHSWLNALVVIVILLFSANIAFPQNTAFSGTITTPSGTPLQSVHIMEKEAGQSTLSDLSGHFSITVNEESIWSLTFFINKKSLKNTVNSAEDITIKWSNAKQSSFQRRNFEEQDLFIIRITPNPLKHSRKISSTGSNVKPKFFFIGNPAKNKIE